MRAPLRTWSLSTLAVLVVIAGAGCAARTKNHHIAPAQDVDMSPAAVLAFEQQVQQYLALHATITGRIPPLGTGASAADIATHQARMQEAIRAGRKQARHGSIFGPKVEPAFRAVIKKELASPEGRQMLQALQQGNPSVEGVPGERNPAHEGLHPVRLVVNGVYDREAPVSSVPTSLLLKLPRLPEQLSYAFVGRHLILRDSEANVILDYITAVTPAAAKKR